MSAKKLSEGRADLIFLVWFRVVWASSNVRLADGIALVFPEGPFHGREIKASEALLNCLFEHGLYPIMKQRLNSKTLGQIQQRFMPFCPHGQGRLGVLGLACRNRVDQPEWFRLH